MKTLEEEFDREIKSKGLEFSSSLNPFDMFELGVNSKHVQAEKIKAQLDILNSFYYGEDLNDEDIMRFYTELHTELTEELQQQLKDLEDGLDGHNKE